MIITDKATAEQQIVAHLINNGQKLVWVAKNIGVSPGHLFLVLKGEGERKRDLTKKNLDKINELLKTDFKKE